MNKLDLKNIFYIFFVVSCLFKTFIIYSVPIQLVEMKNSEGRKIIFVGDIHCSFGVDVADYLDKINFLLAKNDNIRVLYENVIKSKIYFEFKKLSEKKGGTKEDRFLAKLEKLLKKKYSLISQDCEIRDFSILNFADFIIQNGDIVECPFSLDNIFDKLNECLRRGVNIKISNQINKRIFDEKLKKLSEKINLLSKDFDEAFHNSSFDISLASAREMTFGNLINYIRNNRFCDTDGKVDLAIKKLIYGFRMIECYEIEPHFLFDLSIYRLIESSSDNLVIFLGAFHIESIIGLLKNEGWDTIYKTPLIFEGAEVKNNSELNDIIRNKARLLLLQKKNLFNPLNLNELDRINLLNF